MRPAAYGLVPSLLFDIFDPEILVPLVQTWVEEAMDWLVRAGKLQILSIKVRPRFEPARLEITISYWLKEDNVREEFQTEIQSFSPVTSATVRRS